MSMYGKWKPGEKAWPVTHCAQVGEKGYDGMTVQADRDDADINKIISRFQKSGQLPPTLNGEPFYGDVSEIGDFQDCLIKVQEGRRLFDQYPAEVRERFDNDPAKMIEFLADEGNRAEAEELGLVVPRPKPAVPPVVPPPATPAI